VFRIKYDEFLNYPVHFSLLLVDFAVMIFLRPPPLAGLLLLALLVYLSMFFGVKFAQGSEQGPALQDDEAV
jgi:hypothetical protein